MKICNVQNHVDLKIGEALSARRSRSIVSSLIFSLCLCASAVSVFAQETVPAPGPVRSVNIPAVKESKLRNGLTVAVVERRDVPIVTIQLLVRSGASLESMEKAGLANLTADMLTKGTKTRTAEQIAEEIEFLGGSIGSGASWNNASVTVSVTSDKLDQAMAILADVVLEPSFKQEELDLLKTQTLDELKYNLTQPGFLAGYVSSVYSYSEHPAGGTATSIAAITRDDVSAMYSRSFRPGNAVLIVAGDVTSQKASELAERYFGKWTGNGPADQDRAAGRLGGTASNDVVGRILVIDLPNSGQAAVTYAKPVGGVGRGADAYYAASVLNSLLGGGYSSRLNQEIRIKRGLSYGAGSSFGWRAGSSTFGARAQTKNESAAEVAELLVGELRRLSADPITAAELDPRKAVLTGGFGRNVETTGGLVNALADLYTFGIATTALNSYIPNVTKVDSGQVKTFAAGNLNGGDLVIVGDYSVFRDDLAKRFPNMKVDVVKASDLDITSRSLRK